MLAERREVAADCLACYSQAGEGFAQGTPSGVRRPASNSWERAMLPIHLAAILRRIRDGESPEMPTPDEIVPVRVLLTALSGFVALGALLWLWAALR